MPPDTGGSKAGIETATVVIRADPSAPAAARHFVLGLGLPLDPESLERLRLLVSEVVTNGVRHADAPEGSSITMDVIPTDGSVRVEVFDAGHGFDPASLPEPTDLVGGWGLQIVDRLSDRWGRSRDGRSGVWFEMDY